MKTDGERRFVEIEATLGARDLSDNSGLDPL
jgi:hypothetical protein